MNKLKLMLSAATRAATQNYDLYATKHKKGMSFSPNHKVKPLVKELWELTIRGKVVMAYSEKDIIKRLKHKKQYRNGRTLYTC